MKVLIVLLILSLFRTGLGVHCPKQIPNITHAQYKGLDPKYDSRREVGDVLEYRCDEGYTREGENVTCGTDFSWTTIKCVVKCFRDYNVTKVSQLGLTCGTPCETTSDCPRGKFCKCDGPCSRVCVNENVGCGSPPVIENTNVSISGLIARYRCHEGYYLAKGKLSMHCLGSGNIWDNSNEPVCEPVLCGDPRPSIYETQGMMSGKRDHYYYGAVVNFSCPTDYTLYGSPTRHCMDNGQWSGELAACDLTDLPTPPTSASTPCRDTVGFCQLWRSFCGGNNQVQRVCRKTCRMCPEDRSTDRCPHPGRPINGRIIGGNFSIGAIVRFECDKGYIMYGDAEQECLYFREWSGTRAPKCVDYRYPNTPSNIVSTLKRSLSNLPDVEFNAGRSIIASDVKQIHEIYFVLDISMNDLDDIDQLEDATNFTARLVKRLEGFGGKVHYYVVLFPFDNATLRDLSDDNTDKIVEELKDIPKYVRENKHSIKSGFGKATTKALEVVREKINQTDPNSRKHIFMLLRGLPTDGKNAVKVKRDIESSYNYTEFYSITTCTDCNEAEMKEMKELSSGEEGKNFVKIEDFFLLQQYVDQVTTVVENYSECGQIGNQESVNRLASSLNYKTDKGKNAEEDQWRWQVLITKRDKTYAKTLSDDKNVIGGGSIINERWILTAAHVLEFYLPIYPEDIEWMSEIALFVGIWDRPKSANDTVKKSIKAYEMKFYKKHENFNYAQLKYDIALIQVGSQLHEDDMKTKHEGEGLTLGYYVRPVCLPCTGTCVKNEDLVKKGVSLINDATSYEEKCRLEERILLRRHSLSVVTGFGHIKKENESDSSAIPAKRLQVGFLKVAKDDECVQGTGDITQLTGLAYEYTENMICCKPGRKHKRHDACRGDSGGAVARRFKHPAGKAGRKKTEYCWVAIGIVSFGLGCARGDLPGYYTNVARYVQWINETTGGMLPGL